MTEGYLDQLESAADYPGDLGVSYYHHFEPPAAQMRNEMHVEDSLINVVHAWNWVVGRENTAIIRIIFFRQIVSKTWMENFEDFSRLIQG